MSQKNKIAEIKLTTNSFSLLFSVLIISPIVKTKIVHSSLVSVNGLLVGNLMFTNAFLGGHFFVYGQSALMYVFSDARDMNNPLNEVFPKV